MLAELAVWLLTPAPWRFRRLGMVGDSVRLWSRGRRRAADWADHEQHCHAIVRQALAGLGRRDTVVVLGSGLARDVPLGELAAAFRRVILVDAVHLLPLRLKVRRYRNVSLETRDLTGLIDWISGKGRVRVRPLADLASNTAVDLVISANILSQLALPVEDWLERQPDAARRLPSGIGRRLIDWHLEDTADFAGHICLLTDTEFHEITGGGAVSGEYDLLFGRKLPQPDRAWHWQVAPRGELPGGARHVHLACGYADYRPGETRTADVPLRKYPAEPGIA